MEEPEAWAEPGALWRGAGAGACLAGPAAWAEPGGLWCWLRPGLGLRKDLYFNNSVNSLNSLEFKSTGFLNLKSPGVLSSFKFKSPGFLNC